MNDPMLTAITASAALIAVVVVALTALKAWRDWLALQRLSLDGRRPGDMPATTSGARIELADLKERVRKLEAIAAGVDL
ncbi:hypothetical protein FHS31_001063 [Sphingomonas vulcanisoli]|uniref:Uncharacterized protein n=1 Tax=Sphingomonas vulcanisoli TaxID=1658060 RepID=A0ABX0TSU7_9SPHN|nr:hypothetical protein [Sphingomonas vulcanisoli]NIJ07467.1 hypothetical protein [Sphingomonas vulcanisoli]